MCVGAVYQTIDSTEGFHTRSDQRLALFCRCNVSTQGDRLRQRPNLGRHCIEKILASRAKYDSSAFLRCHFCEVCPNPGPTPLMTMTLSLNNIFFLIVHETVHPTLSARASGVNDSHRDCVVAYGPFVRRRMLAVRPLALALYSDTDPRPQRSRMSRRRSVVSQSISESPSSRVQPVVWVNQPLRSSPRTVTSSSA